MARMNLTNRIALITGAAGGIGRGIALALAQRNCNLILTDINEQGLTVTAQLAQPHGVTVHCHQLDISDRQAIKALADTIKAQHEHIDLLVNNAGVALWGTFDEVSEDDFDWLLSINFHGVVDMTRAFLPMLKASDDARLVNTSSIYGFISPPGQVAYSASKFAIRGFSDALRHELANTTVGVSVVHPGGVATQIAENARPPADYPEEAVAQDVEGARTVLTMPPETAGEIIVKGVESRTNRIFVGNDAKLVRFIQRLFPNSYMKILERML